MRRTIRWSLVVALGLAACDDGPVSSTETALGSARGTFTPVAAPAAAHFEARLERLHDGRAILIGGDPGWFPFVGQQTVEAFDPATRTWSPLADAPAPVMWFSSAVLRDGRVLIFGSAATYDHVESYLYDPAADAWSRVGDLPATVANAHGHGSGVLLGDGRVLFAGGFVDGALSDRVFFFDPVSLTWTENQDVHMNAARAGAAAVKLHDGRVLYVGGIEDNHADWCCSASPTADLYDPERDVWTAVNLPPTSTDDWERARYREADNASNPGARWQPCAGVMPDGQVVVAGGTTFGAYGFTIRRSVLGLDPATSSWRELPPMHERRNGCRGGVVGDAFVVAGAGHFDFNWLQTAEIFQHGAWRWADSFTVDPKLTTFGGGAVVLGDEMLLLAGARRLAPTTPNSGGFVAASDSFVFTP